MKRLGIMAAIVLASSALFFGCDNGGEEDSTVKVTGVAISGSGVADGAATIAVGGTLQLTAEVSPDNATDKTVAWSSDTAPVATVDAATGLVTGVSAGTATITATAGGVTATVTITITAPVAVESVAISGNGVTDGAATIAVGGTLQLTAEVSPSNTTNEDKVITWTSDAASVATVDSSTGLVTGVSAGTATITATTAGNTANGAPATATVAITVTAPIERKLVIFNQTGAPDGSTAAGEVADAAFNENDRLTVKNTSTTAGWGTQLEKIAGNTFVYLDTPLQAPFSISARVKITQLIAGAGTDNGVFIGAFTDPTIDNSNPNADDYATFIALAGVNIATNGRRSVYGTRLTTSATDNSAVGSTQFTESTDTEYVYTVTQATVGTYNMLVADDAFDPPRPHAPYTSSGTSRSGDSQIHPVLGKAAAGETAEINSPLYLGIIVSGVEVEISNIIITQGAETVYSKPAPATPYPAVQSVAITNEAGASVEVDGNLQMTASVTPPEAYQGVTWRIDENDAQYASIDEATGALKGLDVGTVHVYAVSVDNGADGSLVTSAAFEVSVTGKQALPNERAWNFQEVPAGWTDAASNSTTVTYTQGMSLLGGLRTATFNSASPAPEDSGFSNGFLQPGGTAANGFATIASVQGPFAITLKYVANAGDNDGRFPTLKIGEEGKASLEPSSSSDSEWKTYWDSVAVVENNEKSTATTDPKTFTYDYTGTDKVDILLVATVNPGRTYDVIIEYKGE
ncbi:MAG: Ig-like domain-containing protein [Treponema sp.]|nr:Ig-like domain-containing protein [Treponema sp.]